MGILEEASEAKECLFIDLFVRVSNDVAVSMYKKLGYEVGDSEYWKDGCEQERVNRGIIALRSRIEKKHSKDSHRINFI